jgi:hypothetical protein
MVKGAAADPILASHARGNDVEHNADVRGTRVSWHS